MKSVLLDSNVLRGISGRRLGDILEAEARAGILQLQDSWTLYELISHLATPGDKAHKSSHHAIRVAARRSFFRDLPQILFPTESLVASMLFGEEPPGVADTMGVLVECCEHIAQTPEGGDLGPVQTTIHEIAQNVARLEGWFAEHIRGLTATLLQVTVNHLGKPDRGVIRAFLRSHLARLDAIALINRAYAQAGRVAPDPPPDDQIQAVATTCVAGTAVLSEALVMIICDGANLDSSHIRNLLWDQEVAFPVGQRVRETEVHLVTNDKVFARSLVHNNLDRFVISLDEYLREINVADAV